MVVLVLPISVFPTLFGMTLVAHRPGCFTGGKLKIWNFFLESVFFLLELIQIYINVHYFINEDLAAVKRDSSQ